MDYASNTAAKLGSSANPGRPLEQVSLAAMRVNSAVVRVNSFIERFHGATPAPAGASEPEQCQPPYGYSLDQLFGAIERLETRLDSLEAIG